MDIRKVTLANEDYFRVVSQSPWSQVAVMCIKTADHGIAREFHSVSEQSFYVEAGSALINFTNPQNRQSSTVHLQAGQMVDVPPGVYHDVVKLETVDLKMWTRYSPPNPEHYMGEVKRRNPNAVSSKEDAQA